MIIELWGVRGSLPSPTGNAEYRLKLREILQMAVEKKVSSPADIELFLSALPHSLQYVYGGNTTCVSVQSKSGRLYILDCGTGVRTLGDILMKGKSAKGQEKIDIFITHTHWDHIQGVPFFKPLYIPGNEVTFYSGIPDLHDRLKYQQTERFFPVPFDAMAAGRNFMLMTEGTTLQLEEGLTVECCRIKHPGGSMAYRFTENGKSFVFATDAEFNGEYLEQMKPAQDAFFTDAELLIIDSQYTLNEAFKKFDWGHTSYTMAVNCAVRWNTHHLVLTHHEPAYFDDKLETIASEAVDHRNALESETPVVHMAREGMRFVI
jgi:phosphoribosyl 1,2-cyclic phosphodiesterase